MSLNRRQFLTHTMHGFSGVALAAMLAEEARGELPKIDPAKPYKPRPTHFAPKAKRVIEVFCSGALSHVDTFDYKPELIRRHGQPLPGNEKLVSFQGPNGNLTQPLWTFRPRGQCEKMVSDLVPHIGALADEISTTSAPFCPKKVSHSRGVWSRWSLWTAQARALDTFTGWPSK